MVYYWVPAADGAADVAASLSCSIYISANMSTLHIWATYSSGLMKWVDAMMWMWFHSFLETHSWRKKNSETSTLGEHTCLIFQFSTYLLKYTAYVRGVSLLPLPKMGVPLPAILSVRQSTSPSYADFYGCSLGL